jgi:hypothetical protein
VGGQLHDPAALPPWKQPPWDRRLGGSQSWSGNYGGKSLASAGNRTPAVQPIACRHADRAILAPHIYTAHWCVQVFDLFIVHLMIISNSVQDYIASNDRVIGNDELQMDVEGNGRDLN